METSNSSAHEGHATARLRWGVRIPLRDGVHLNATLYLPAERVAPAPTLFTLTPYVAERFHEDALYFAAHGYPCLTIDTRGRGSSEGAFKPNINEAQDGYDVVEWLAMQPYCDGRVAMWGGSYGGYDQWATAKEFPPHLATIIPVASPYMGVDFPHVGNIASPYWMRWLTLVYGRASQERIFYDKAYWRGEFRRFHVSGAPFRELDAFLGSPSAVFQEWATHPRQDEYWDRYNPTVVQYGRLTLPILTITGHCDVDQLGALTHFRKHWRHTSEAGRSRHYLVIGPWDHAGTRAPQLEFCGLKVGPESLVDLKRLQREWYDWTLREGPRPEFLKKNVAYYVTGVETWRYADTLEAITDHTETLFLHSSTNPNDVFRSGSLERTAPTTGGPDFYVHDPRDTTQAELEAEVDPENRTDSRMLSVLAGRQLIYHSGPFDHDAEVSGFFRLSLWISIDQPDADFRIAVYEIGSDGASLLLTADTQRARYRQGPREQQLIRTQDPLLYRFDGFPFIARRIRAGHRLRLVIGPLHSIYSERNCNTGGTVAEERIQDARIVTVQVFHDATRRSALYVPIATHIPVGHGLC